MAKKNILFDLLRIVLTFLVVNIHIRNVTHGKINFLESYGYYAVPLFVTLSFFLMSKYFSQTKLTFKVVLSRIKRLFPSLVFWSGVGFLLKPNLVNIRNIFLQLFTGKVVNTPLYYLNNLIVLTIIFWLITYLPTKLRSPLYFAIIFIAFFLEYTGLNTSFFNPMGDEIRKSYGQIVELIKYASLGVLFGILVKKNKKNFVLIGLIGCMILLLSIFNFPQPWGYNYSGLKLFLGTILVFSFVLLIDHVNFSEKINKNISILGSYSFGVYLSHYLLLETTLKYCPQLKPFITTNQTFFLLSFTIFCYLFIMFADFITLKKISYLVK